MEEIKQIYSNLNSFLNEILIIPTSKKEVNEVGEDSDGQPSYEVLNSIEVSFNYGPFHLFKKELYNILTTTERLLKKFIDLGNIDNKREISSIITGLIKKIENREVFYIESKDANDSLKDYIVNTKFISGITMLLIDHRDRVWDHLSSSDHNMIDEKMQLSPLVWKKHKTDLVELVTVLHVTKSINNHEGNLTRDQAIDIFSRLFDIDLKNADSLLSRGADRSESGSPFLKYLDVSFDDYVKGLSKKQEDRYKGRKNF